MYWPNLTPTFGRFEIIGVMQHLLTKLKRQLHTDLESYNMSQFKAYNMIVRSCIFHLLISWKDNTKINSIRYRMCLNIGLSSYSVYENFSLALEWGNMTFIIIQRDNEMS